jgi:hypothetical protein
MKNKDIVDIIPQDEGDKAARGNEGPVSTLLALFDEFKT